MRSADLRSGQGAGKFDDGTIFVVTFGNAPVLTYKQYQANLAANSGKSQQTATTAPAEDPITAKCKSYGFKKNTTAFANCAMNLEQAAIQQQRQQSMAAAQARAQQEEAEAEKGRRVAAAIANWSNQQEQNRRSSAPIQTNCNQVGYGFNCQTYR